MKRIQSIAALGFLALVATPDISRADDSETIYLSQCDGCTAQQARQKILDENDVGLAQSWFSIDGANKTVQAFRVDALPKHPGNPTPSQSQGAHDFYLTSIANDGRVDSLTQPLIAFYNMTPAGWEKAIGPGADASSEKALGVTGFNADRPALAAYPDPAVTAWHAVDAGSTTHNAVVDYVNDSPVADIRSMRAQLSDAFGAKAQIERHGGIVAFAPSFRVDLRVAVPFADGSRLSLKYGEKGWITDPRFGNTRDSNGNSIPVTADQIAAPRGIHVYDFRPKSWPTNANDPIYFARRVGALSRGTAVVASSPVLGCTSIGGKPVNCQKFLIP